MKWFNGASLALFAASASASPMPQKDMPQPDMPGAYDMSKIRPSYSLKVQSDSDQVDGKYLSFSESTVGINLSDEPLRVFTEKSDGDAERFSLQPLGPGSSRHVLAFKGENGLFDLYRVADPSAIADVPGQEEVVSWDDFTLDKDSKELGWAYEGADVVTIARKDEEESGTNWVVFPGEGDDEWSLKWYQPNSETVVTQDFIPVDIVYEPANQNITTRPWGI